MKTLVALLTLLTACLAQKPPTIPALPGPTLAQTSRLATHNSYWVNHGAEGDLFASGVGERLLDQLLHENVRSLELDVHPDPDKPHHFLIYHTLPGNGVCQDLQTCLQPLMLAEELTPMHAVIVILELKGITAPVFDAQHSPEDLDAELQQTLGDRLVQPKDLLARCPPETTLSACVQKKGWPLETELAGKVLVATLGNWDGLPGAVAPTDWAKYAVDKPIQQRVAFPMGSSWQREVTQLSADNQALLTAKQWNAAWAQTAILQIETFDDPLLQPALLAGQIVRADNVFTLADQQKAEKLGIQLWQTDWPWVTARVDADVLPLPGAPPLVEVQPPVRVEMPPPEASEVGRTTQDFVQLAEGPLWHAVIVSGLAEGVTPCLAAGLGLDPDQDGASWCQHKQPAVHVGPGDLAPADPQAEEMTMIWTVCHQGQCQQQTFPAPQWRMTLRVKCTANSCCATPGYLDRFGIAAAVAPDACFVADSLWQGHFVRWGPALSYAGEHVWYYSGP